MKTKGLKQEQSTGRGLRRLQSNQLDQFDPIIRAALNPSEVFICFYFVRFKEWNWRGPVRK